MGLRTRPQSTTARPVSNALKFCDADTPLVEVGAERQGEDRWHFVVADNGIGIDPRFAERVFKMFQNVVLTTSGAEGDIQRTYDLAATSYLTKPVEPASCAGCSARSGRCRRADAVAGPPRPRLPLRAAAPVEELLS